MSSLFDKSSDPQGPQQAQAPTCRAIETEYNGYRFRSRLEARWAVFFDALGVRYEYEPEGFDLGDGVWYLPDFYLPDVNEGIYIEVKGKMDDCSYRKIEAFWHSIGTPLYILGGIPTQADLESCSPYWYVGKYERCFEYGCGPVEDWRNVMHTAGWDWPYLFCLCPACGKVGVEFDGRGWRVCGYRHHEDVDVFAGIYTDENRAVRRFACPNAAHIDHDDKGYTWNQRRLVAAYSVARQARFEHGETPTRQEVQRRYAAETED